LLATAAVAVRDRKVAGRSRLWQKRRSFWSAVGLKQSFHRSAVTKAERESTYDAARGGWPRAAFDFLGALGDFSELTGAVDALRHP